MGVTVGYEIEGEVIDVNDIHGGLNVFVDGTRIGRYEDEVSNEWRYPWNPEYVGEFLHTDLMALIDRTQSLSTGQTAIYQMELVRFKPALTRLVLEPLSASDLRIAFRTTRGNLGTPPLPAPESARGYVVDRCEFCHAVSDAAHEYLREVQSFPLEWGEDLLDEFVANLEALDEALETCGETPPSLS